MMFIVIGIFSRSLRGIWIWIFEWMDQGKFDYSREWIMIQAFANFHLQCDPTQPRHIAKNTYPRSLIYTPLSPNMNTYVPSKSLTQESKKSRTGWTSYTTRTWIVICTAFIARSTSPHSAGTARSAITVSVDSTITATGWESASERKTISCFCSFCSLVASRCCFSRYSRFGSFEFRWSIFFVKIAVANTHIIKKEWVGQVYYSFKINILDYFQRKIMICKYVLCQHLKNLSLTS